MGTGIVIPAAVKVLALIAALLGILKGGSELDKLFIKKDRKWIHEKAKVALKRLDDIQIKDFLNTTCGWLDDLILKSKRHKWLTTFVYILLIGCCVGIGSLFFGLFDNRAFLNEFVISVDMPDLKFYVQKHSSEYATTVSIFVLSSCDVISSFLAFRVIKLLKETDFISRLFFLCVYTIFFLNLILILQGTLYFGLYTVRGFEKTNFPAQQHLGKIQCIENINYDGQAASVSGNLRLEFDGGKGLKLWDCINVAYEGLFLYLFSQKPTIVVPNVIVADPNDRWVGAYSSLYLQKVSLWNYLFAGSVTIPVLLLLLYLLFLFAFKYIAMAAKFIPWVVVRKLGEDEKEVEPFKLMAIVADVMILIITGIIWILRN